MSDNRATELMIIQAAIANLKNAALGAATEIASFAARISANATLDATPDQLAEIAADALVIQSAADGLHLAVAAAETPTPTRGRSALTMQTHHRPRPSGRPRLTH